MKRERGWKSKAAFGYGLYGRRKKGVGEWSATLPFLCLDEQGLAHPPLHILYTYVGVAL